MYEISLHKMLCHISSKYNDKSCKFIRNKCIYFQITRNRELEGFESEIAS